LAIDSAQSEIHQKLKIAKFASDDESPNPVVQKIGDDDIFQLRLDVPPDEAIDYFKRKKILDPDEFRKLTGKAKAGGFSISGIYQSDVLEGFHTEILDALETGKSQQQVVKRFKEILSGAGHEMLGNFHLESVFRSNMMTAYGVGRRRSMEEVADLLPYWEYQDVGDDRVRPTHRVLHGVIYPATHIFWSTHYPPWDFNCRCWVNALLDMPDDYDHDRPNEDSEIAYDKKGLPAEAVYKGMQTVDLKSTNFTGIPSAPDLEKVLKANAARKRDQRKNN
jgi:SPP1 gp7 family putative phage head morphogenesis protein